MQLASGYSKAVVLLGITGVGLVDYCLQFPECQGDIGGITGIVYVGMIQKRSWQGPDSGFSCDMGPEDGGEDKERRFRRRHTSSESAARP